MQQLGYQLPEGFFLHGRLYLKPRGAQPATITEATLAQMIADGETVMQGWRDALTQYRAYRDNWDAEAIVSLDELADEVKRNLGG